MPTGRETLWFVGGIAVAMFVIPWVRQMWAARQGG